MTAVAAATESAVAGATEHLLSARFADGWWRDFWTPAGTSDAWVTGYVGAALAQAPAERAREAAAEAWVLVECDRFADRGWGYGPGVPVDADSTCWNLALAERLDRWASERVARARGCLAEHLLATGVATYRHPHEIRGFMRLPDGVDVSAWCRPHVCVTAAAACLAPFRAALVGPLLESQRADGRWESYWWSTPAYATAFAVRALAPLDRPDARAAVACAIRWARSVVARSGPPEDAFETALLLGTLATAAEGGAEAAACLDRLLRTQDEDGGWRGSARLRIPRPDVRRPERVRRWTRWLGQAPGASLDERLRTTFSVWSLDQRSTFTTATVLDALVRFAQVERRAVRRPLRGGPPPAPAVEPETVRAFSRDGHATIRGALPADRVAAVRAPLRASVAALAADPRAAADRAAFVRAEGMWRADEDVRRLVLDPRLAAVAAALLRVRHVRVYHDQAFFKRQGSARTPWHQDMAFWPLWDSDAVTLWIPLSRATPRAGTLQFVSGSHRLGPLGDVDRLNASPTELDALVERHELRISPPLSLVAGDVSAHHGWTLHGAAANGSARSREVLTVVYFPDGARVRNPPPPAGPSRYEAEAAMGRDGDLRRWLPGLAEGDRAVTRMNPLPSALAG